LRYLIPFRPPAEISAYLRDLRSASRPLAVFVDDGEKFGGWPGTKDWVYTRGRHECRNGVAELREPAARVHPVFGPGPTAELLAVVHEYGERTARLPQLTEVGADLRRRPEGNEIAEPLVDRKQPDALAAALGQERRMQPVPLESTHQEVPVVLEQIPHAGIGQVGGQIGLPHPLGEPQAGRFDAEAASDRFAHPADLLESIRTRQRREHRLVESRQQQLEVTVRRQATDRIEVGGGVGLEPFEQRSRDV